MDNHGGIIIFHIVLTLVSGFWQTTDRFPGQKVCARINCKVNELPRAYITAIRFNEYFNNSMQLIRLAYITNNGDSIYINESKGNDIKVTGSITGDDVNMTVEFHKEYDCVFGLFYCKVDITVADGDPLWIMSVLSEEIRVAYLEGSFKWIPSPNISAILSNASSYEKSMLGGTVQPLCDIETDSGGWVIIQSRKKGDTDFFKPWVYYKHGFGTPDADFWLGLENMHYLNSQGYTLLRIDMEHQGRKYFALYSNFSVADEESKYRLTVGNYSGTAGDSLSYSNGMYFSTFDRDSDAAPINCARNRYGAWWYKYCSKSNLNGWWGSIEANGLVWETISHIGSVSSSEMKVRHV